MMSQRFRLPEPILANLQIRPFLLPAVPLPAEKKTLLQGELALGQRLRGQRYPPEEKPQRTEGRFLFIDVGKGHVDFPKIRGKIIDVLTGQKDHGFCTELDPMNVVGFVGDADVLLVALDRQNISSIAEVSLQGFAAITNVDYKEKGLVWKIDVVCAGGPSGRGIGTGLIVNLEARARRVGVTAIVLDALPSAMGFWRKMGYVNSQWPNCKEPLAVTALWTKLVKEYGPKPLDDDNADDQFQELLNDLDLMQFKEDGDGDDPFPLFPMIKCPQQPTTIQPQVISPMQISRPDFKAQTTNPPVLNAPPRPAPFLASHSAEKIVPMDITKGGSSSSPKIISISPFPSVYHFYS